MNESGGKVALVTGTSAGIGYAAAIALQEAGFTVFATAPELTVEMDELRAKGCETLQLDVTDETSRIAAVRAAEQVNGSISILVNNAGYGQYGPIEEIPLDAIRKQFEVNVFGLIRMCQLALPAMRRAGFGRIINVSSVAGEVNEPGTGIYHATKHAVEAIDQTLRMEVSTFGVNVIGILPGPVSTEFADVAVASIPDTGADSPYFVFKQNLAKYTREMLSPDKTMTLTPEDVAETIVKAATAENPDTNYHVGMMSKTMSAVAGIVPDKIWDAMMQRQIPVDEKK
jgi:short-subunit dehydrogenase